MEMEIEKKEENRRKRNRSGDDDDTDCEGSKARRKEVMDIASSSSSVAAPADADDTKKYDVFISFRGDDTRRTFTSHLHAAFLEKKITTYIDDKLKRGDEIAPALLEAIKQSELSVIIFSKNYASSTWCLDELVHILECKEKHGQLVIPIFYDTLPSDVRKQRGSYALDLLEQRFENRIDKVHKWRDALTNAANISGFDSKNYGTDADLVKEVVKDIWAKLYSESSCDLKGYVGIESHIKKIESLLSIRSPDTCITVGIWGMGGIGKTTLAETVFHKLSSKFEASCFVKNVRENSEKADGLDHLEKTLLKEILKEEGLSMGAPSVRKSLSRTKVLIVLDDVSSSMQMKRLAGDLLRYGTGSRIIITTRDRGTLGQTVEEDNIYKVEELKPDDALQLFYSRAFKDNSTRRTDYKEWAEKVVAYAKGVPLALTVLGSLFFNCRSKEDWEDEFNKLKRFPSEDIQKVLRISYDRLRETENEIFLDIACFHKGGSLVDVKRMLDVRGFFATSGIRTLIEMSLISIDSKWGWETIEMHDLLQEMGRKIVQEQGIKDPGKRSRLFNDEDVHHVLKSSTETPNVEAIKLNWQKPKYRLLKRADFKKMSNLIMLSSCGPLTASLDLPDSLCYLKWSHYALESLPSNFCPKNLVELHMPYSKVKKLWKEEQILVNLQIINLESCRDLTEVPNLSGSLKRLSLAGCSKLEHFPEILEPMEHLESLILSGTAVKELHSSIELLPVLERLELQYCKGLSSIPKSICKLKCLKELNLAKCSKLQHFPEILEPMEHLESLILSGTAVKELHSSIELLPVLERLELQYCKGLSSIPKSTCKLKCLKELDLTWCSKLEHFPEILEPMEHLESLILSTTAVKELHSSIELLPVLERLELKHCEGLSSIPKSICKLKCLKQLDLTCCSKLVHFPEILEPMEHLKSLNLRGTTVKELHSSIELLPVLETLELQDCKWLSSIPKSICKLKCLKVLNLSCCSTLQHFPEILEPMEHLESLILSGTAVKELHSLIELLPVLERLELQGCKGLSSIPKSICKFQCLKQLSLAKCSKLEHFPEILEPMEHLESLILSGTAVKELHSSIELLPVLERLELRGCKGLSSIPKSICKLKCLKQLSLAKCSKLEHFPEILEPMEHLESLILSGTAVKELHSSIELLPVLERLELRGCKGLSSIPKSICKLKCLKQLSLAKCSKLEHFPEILEPMEHLESLILSGTAVKELHSSIELLPVLEILELRGCKGLSSIPKSICKLKCLKVLDLSCWFTLQHFPEILEPMEHLGFLISSGTTVKELHSSIELLPVLERLELQYCKGLSSIPKSICKLKCLKELNLTWCSKLEHFPEILEPMEHLESLILSRTAVKELHSSIELLPVLERLELQGCEGLSSIPKSICKLKCLKVLDLSGCSTLQHFPEILEPMEHLESLILSGTAVKELHSSIELLPVLKILELQDCKWLSSIPKSICKLKCLTQLSLARCSKLEHFPEILEPMEHLESLILSGTAVKEPHSSIELLPVLERLELFYCKGLSSIPKSICKLKCLKELNITWCSKLEHLPEILEPMEHLESLILSGTAVKELHSSIELLPVLERLELQGCKGLSSIPKSICKLKCLKVLDLSGCSTLKHFPEILEPMEHLESLILSGTAVKELHSSIELLPVLKRLELQDCKWLSSIPKSICKLKCLKQLSLARCSKLEHFPEILEPMEHLESLILSGTTVKELHSSIELLPVLKTLELQDCKWLSSIPKSICKLKCLEELDLFGCSILRNFPEILEPMEHLESLKLSRTKVKQLYTSSIQFLPALKNIELEGCDMLSCISKSMLKYVNSPDLEQVESSDESEANESEQVESSDESMIEASEIEDYLDF